jgi:hypothetical protein
VVADDRLAEEVGRERETAAAKLLDRPKCFVGHRSGNKPPRHMSGAEA